MVPRLGVNVDHVATVREARRAPYPDPVLAALLAEQAGAEQITVHLRADRRHIQDADLDALRRAVQTVLNVEMAPTPEMMEIAARVRPDTVTLVAERPDEVTTEGGLDVVGQRALAGSSLRGLERAGIRPSVFLDPDGEQVRASADLGTRVVELNTARYAETRDPDVRSQELERLRRAAQQAVALSLEVAAGHGLHYHNLQALLGLGLIAEYNIGHALVARALFTGIGPAVRDMVDLLRSGVLHPVPRLDAGGGAR